MAMPAQVKVYHIVHVDRLASIAVRYGDRPARALPADGHRPPVEICGEWYY